MSVNTFQRTGTLTAAAFERLLQTLDPDRDRAAAAYERLRERIAGLMQWWGASIASELADETLDRVARKLEAGTVIREGSLGAFVRGVARLVFYEASRSRLHETPLPNNRDLAVPDPAENSEPALVCLDQCLSSLGSDDRNLVLRYYDMGETGKADARRRLGGEVGVSMAALRIRAFRLRERLERCVSACLGQT